jgi:hypothetical protein
MAEGVPLAELTDAVYAAGVLDRVELRLLGVPLQIRAYVQILAALGVGGYRDEELGLSGAVDYGDEHFTCFQFPYDWRRDNVENARRLAEFIAEKRAFVRRETVRRTGVDPGEVKFDVVAHSMGALLLRYYLRYGAADLPADGPLPEPTWAGAREVERAVLIGPPNLGSLDALRALVEGRDFGPTIPRYPAALLGTYPAAYQLLPRGRHGALQEVAEDGAVQRVEDVLDPALWRRHGWGLADPGQDPVLAMLLPQVTDPRARRRVALDHLDKSLRRARRFAAALDRPSRPPPGLEMMLVAGDAKPTERTLRVDAATGRLRVAARAPGDGTVLRSSALGDERTEMGRPWTPALSSPVVWDQVIFLFTDHLGLTRDPVFTDNVLYWLLEDPR